MLVISVSGAGCTGKTTLIRHIKSILEDKGYGKVKVCGEFIRTIFEEKYSNKYNSFNDLLSGNPRDIINIHKEASRMCIEFLHEEHEEPILLFDRCPIDALIYMYMNVAPYLDDSDVLHEYMQAASCIHTCIQEFKNYFPIMFYTTPFSDEVEEDGFRPMSLINRRALELALFDKEFYSIPGVRCLPKNLEERLEYLDEYF